MSKTALIIGVSSQDGSYLADLLLEKGYDVVGTIRRSTTYARENINHLVGKIRIEAAELGDYGSIARVMLDARPDEIYNIAAQSVPADSWGHPFQTADITGVGVVRVLEAARTHAPDARLYQATSREIWGGVAGGSADESTPVSANNPYGIAKAYAHMMVGCYRESYGLHACSGILFNHESPRRSLHFVTRKITAAVACIKNEVKQLPINELGEPIVNADQMLALGWLGAQRDWGYAPEYVEAMWLMLQQPEPKDYVIGTNSSHTVQEVCEIAFGHVGLDWREHVVSAERFRRPTEIGALKGDYSAAKRDLGWEPKMPFEKLITTMVDADLERFR